MMRMSSAMFALVVAVGAVGCAGQLGTGGTDEQGAGLTSSVQQGGYFWLPASGKSGAVADSQATLLRQSTWMKHESFVTGLVPGHVFTVWWIFFNNPQSCGGGGPNGTRCSFADIGNAAVQASFEGGGGGIVDGSGDLYVENSINENDASRCVSGAPLPCNGGLHDASTADVMLITRDHGPPQDGILDQQQTTFGGGCANYPCVNLQLAAFQAGK